ncbi:dTDP-glucose 4,6-dehydratase [bacterium]|nr:dTDP-glucose 4,6-dehydratase [bacterium]MCP5462656.1 dTDP-glucose 4,6-dehydratase [bacterium]
MKNILVTGGAGFIGSNFIHYLLGISSDYSIINVDCLTYAGNLENLSAVEHHPQYRFIKSNINNAELIEHIIRSYSIDTIVNFAAESHVDRSIEGPEIFVTTNVQGTLTLLEAARKHSIKKFLQVSTDEVYGSLGKEGKFTEDLPLRPNSPYSASKASADLLVRAYGKTYGFPVLITRCSNNYGPYQFPEKLIPLMIKNALANKKLPVYGNGKNVRDWIHVLDHASALYTVLLQGKIGEVYNVGGNNEWENIMIVKEILRLLNKPESLIEFVKDRPGHDFRYSIDNTKIKNDLGWAPAYTFESGLKNTIDWYLSNEQWVAHCTSGDYQTYYEKMYGNRAL